MSKRRVVVTGVGIVSPIGNSLAAASLSLREGRHGIVHTDLFGQIEHLRTRLSAPVVGLELNYPRKKVRTMGRVALLSLAATEQALAQAGLPEEALHHPRTGIA